MNDVRISGFKDFRPDGSIYGNVSVSGSGDVLGDLSCASLTLSGCGDVSGSVSADGDVRISGSGDITGFVHAGGNVGISGSGDICKEVIAGGEVRISGAGDIRGRVECSEFVLSGAGDVRGDVKCSGTVMISGAGDVGGSVKALNLFISGASSIKNDVSCEHAKLSGACDIGGLLNAEEIRIELGAVSIGEIGCTKLDVVAKTVIDKHNKVYLKCKSIEGDDIYLTRTIADVVRGRNVKIGAGCDIKRVEYTDTIEFEGESKIGQQIKI